MIARWRARRRSDRGSATLELVALAPVFFGFVAMVVYVGKLNIGSAHAEAAARTAARTMTLSRDPAAAEEGAEAVARDVANEGAVICTTMGFDADIRPDEVEVTVTCTIALREVGLLGVPGSRTVTATATEAIDRYREAP